MRVVLVRHAEAAAMPGTPDHDRPLTARGERDAVAMGAWLRDRVPRVSVIRCSTAVRARRTCELVLRELRAAPDVQMAEPDFSRELYRADSEDLLDLVRARADFPDTAPDGVFLLIGHNPAIGEAAHTLAGEPLPDFAAGAVAVFDINHERAVASKLVAFAAPEQFRS